MRIVQLANFISPTSGGIRTLLSRLRQGYEEAGHETVLVVPGDETRFNETEDGLIVSIKAPKLPGTGYRFILDLGGVYGIMDRLAPDRVEVNDRFSLRTVGEWAKERNVRSMVVVHERLDRLASMWVPWLLRPGLIARRDNASMALPFDTVVCPSRWSASEFANADIPAVHAVSWGVDLEAFHPQHRNQERRSELIEDAEVLIAVVCRLSAEKKVWSAIDAVGDLRRRGVNARMVIAGTGHAAGELKRRAAGLPITFLGHVDGRHAVAELLASADVAICPGPIETFGLAAMEALASGTPVVSSNSGAIGEMLDEPFGVPAYNHGPAMAAATHRLLRNGEEARIEARKRAEQYPWSRAIQTMLHLHDLGPAPEGVDVSPVYGRLAQQR